MAVPRKLSEGKIELIGQNVDRLISLNVAGREFIDIMLLCTHPPGKDMAGPCVY
jgi:hypothetical protein